MGCPWSKLYRRQTLEETSVTEIAKPQYSWDKRDKINVKDFIIEDVKNETVGRLPGSVDGQQLVIQNCHDCCIYVYDHSATITIDDCINCKLFLGPVKTSVFLRDCKNCQLMVSCQQFRTRDCRQIDVFLSCTTQPIIEASTAMRFGCYQFYYPELEAQFKAACLSAYNNSWSTIHDFTPVPGETNYSLVPEDSIYHIEDYIPLPKTEKFESMQLSTDPRKSTVPVTLGVRRKQADESCLVVLFNDGGSHDRAIRLIENLKQENSAIVLVQSKEVTMQYQDAVRVFGSVSYELAVSQGQVIGLEFNGTGSVKCCQDCVVNLTKGTTGVAFVSQSPQNAVNQIEQFYNFADMQLQI